MDRFSGRKCLAGAFAAGLLFLCPGQPAAAEVDVVKTNWTDRWITNLIEITVPANKFVNLYRTNHVERFSTNVLDVYATNWATLTFTNPVSVDVLRTNFTDDYHTNWITLSLTNDVAVSALRTNFLESYRTNLHLRTFTNEVAVDDYRTNLVNRYHTNLKTLTLTNWEQVLVMKTNWVAQFVTNVVQLDFTTNGSLAAERPVHKETVPEPSPAIQALPSVTWTEGLEIRAALTSATDTGNQVEVQLRASWNGDSAVPLRVEQWRVERQDAAILLFGQNQEFKRVLPVGTYKVEVRARLEINGPLLAGRGTLQLSPSAAAINQKLVGQN